MPQGRLPASVDVINRRKLQCYNQQVLKSNLEYPIIDYDAYHSELFRNLLNCASCYNSKLSECLPCINKWYDTF